MPYFWRKPSITVLPSARVKLPVCESSVVIAVPSMASANPSARSLAGADPVVPSSTTMLVGRVAEGLGCPLTGRHALLLEVQADPGRVQVVRRRDRAVFEDDRDAGLLGLVEHVVPAVFHDRRDDDRVDALVDEAADRGDLRLDLVVGRVEDELEAVLLRERRLHRLGVRGTPAALGAGLGESDGDDAVVLAAAASGSAGTSGHREGEGSRDRDAADEFLHKSKTSLSWPGASAGAWFTRWNPRGPVARMLALTTGRIAMHVR